MKAKGIRPQIIRDAERLSTLIEAFLKKNPSEREQLSPADALLMQELRNELVRILQKSKPVTETGQAPSIPFCQS